MPQGHEPRVLDVESVGDVTLARVNCRRLWDEEEAQALGHQLTDLLDQGGCRWLIVSLARAEAVSSAALGRLIALHKRAEALGGRLALCNLNAHLREGLDVARLSHFFHIYRDEQEAALSFKTPSAPDGRGGL
jgi:anti-sigma B factor antagonist